MSDWICYGQTNLKSKSWVENPPTNKGLVGAVSLPYHVPEGKTLVIDSQAIEGNKGPISGLFVYLGPKGVDPKDINSRSLATVASFSGSAQYTGLSWKVKGPEQVNVRLMNASDFENVHGWYVQGHVVTT